MAMSIIEAMAVAAEFEALDGKMPLTSVGASLVALAAEVRRLQAQVEWRPIDTYDRMVHGSDVLIAGRYPSGVSWAEEGHHHPHGHWVGRKFDPPTHWRPITPGPGEAP